MGATEYMAKSKKRAFISGITGQDGSYLAEILLADGYEVHGFLRRSSAPVEAARFRLEHLKGKITFHYGDITDPFSIMWALKKSNPHEIYHMAAQSHVQVSWETPWYTAQATGVGTLNLLESVRILGMKPKIYNASTSELFNGTEGFQDENTPKDPISPYGTAKLYAFQIAKNYRDAFGMFICNGILFNHESERRGDSFVTKKIVNDARTGVVRLGNVNASRDWGLAKEYMTMAWKMLQQKGPDDYVIATGETHTVKEFVSWVEQIIGTKVKIIHDKEYDRPKDVHVLRGNSEKARKKLGWKPKIKGKLLALEMLYGKE